MKVECIKDDVGWWSVGRTYPATHSAGGFIQLGDDDDLDDHVWSAAPVEYKEDGSIIYAIGGIDGAVHFEEKGTDDGN